jgi:mono/diheme cytochrome c family protein
MSSENNGGVEARNINILNLNGGTNMKNANIRMVATLTAIAVLSFPSLSAHAQDGSATYKAKCAMCHGADGTKMAAHDLQGAAAQGMSDADLSAIITNGKGKMPASKSLKPDQVAALVAYVRTLKK